MPAASDPRGYYILGNAFSAALSPVVAGSTHFLLANGGYAVWATQPFLLFITNAANDPAAVPAVQGTGYPGALVAPNAPVEFIFDSSQTVDVGGVTLSPTGIRCVTLGAAGTFYVSQFSTRLF